MRAVVAARSRTGHTASTQLEATFGGALNGAGAIAGKVVAINRV